jgi:hypothetical protein
MKRIPLTQEQFATVDDDDFERLSRFKYWAAFDLSSGKFIPRRHVKSIRNSRGNWSPIYRTMASDVFGIRPGLQIDHRNLNPLDNRKENLRWATIRQNSWNRRKRNNQSTGYTGVECTPFGRFRARIQTDGHNLHLGCFSTAQEAALAYNRAALKLFGQFARLNQLESEG